MNIYTCRKVPLGFPGTRTWRQENVSAPYWRAYWNDAPGAFVKVAGRELELGPDRIVALPPRTVYSTRTERGSYHFYVHFTVDAPYSQVKPELLVFKSARLLSLASSLAAELSDSPPGTKTLLKAEIYIGELLLSLPDAKLPSGKPLDPRIEKALSLMDASPGITIAGLASAVNMCRNSFLALFRRETGSAPQQLARQRRLEKACLLLHFGSEDIKQIAEETGFCDRYHFSRAFKREYGCGPAEFRKQLKF